MDELETILDSYHYNTLLEIARHSRLPIGQARGNPRKAELMAALRTGLFSRERVGEALQRLNERDRRALHRLLLRGGSAATSSFRRELISTGLASEPPANQRGDDYYYGGYGVPYDRGVYTGHADRLTSRAFEDVIARLTAHGLVFSRLDGSYADGQPIPKLQVHPAASLYIPEAIRAWLPAPAPEPSDASFRPATIHDGEPTVLLRDLYIYWGTARSQGLPQNQNGSVAKRALKAINNQLLVPEPQLEAARSEQEAPRLAMLRQLLQALGLLRTVDGQLRPSHSDPLHIPDFWGLPQPQQLRACLEAWPRLLSLGELSSEAEMTEPDYAGARQALLKALTKRPDAWLRLGDLAEELRAEDIDFLLRQHGQAERSRSQWYYSAGSGYPSGQRAQVLQIFTEIEDTFVQRSLTGFLHQVGLVELGYDGDDLVACRVGRLGRAILGLAQEGREAPQEHAGRVIVQPSFQVMAMGPVSLDVLARLDLFAQRERADRGAFEYRMSRESIYRGQQVGLETAEIVHFLAQAAAAELPQNVRRSLEEWGAHHERIVIRSGVSLLQTATAALLHELLEAPEARPHLARAVAPDVALVVHGARERLSSALVARGAFPAISSAEPQSADRSVVVDEEGVIRPIHAVPSLHLRARLARLAEEGESGWRLTATSVRRAGGTRARVLALLEELRKLHRGPLPERLVERVKAWGGYYGDAITGTLTLIEFRDTATLDELRRHPELQARLTPFAAGGRALASVRSEDLTPLRKTLSELGVRVREGL